MPKRDRRNILPTMDDLRVLGDDLRAQYEEILRLRAELDRLQSPPRKKQVTAKRKMWAASSLSRALMKISSWLGERACRCGVVGMGAERHRGGACAGSGRPRKPGWRIQLAPAAWCRPPSCVIETNSVAARWSSLEAIRRIGPHPLA